MEKELEDEAASPSHTPVMRAVSGRAVTGGRWRRNLRRGSQSVTHTCHEIDTIFQ